MSAADTASRDDVLSVLSSPGHRGLASNAGHLTMEERKLVQTQKAAMLARSLVGYKKPDGETVYMEPPATTPTRPPPRGTTPASAAASASAADVDEYDAAKSAASLLGEPVLDARPVHKLRTD